MSISLRRFQSDESDFSQTGRQRAMITVPGSVGYTDLSESKIVFEILPTVTSGGNAMPWPVTFVQPTGRTQTDCAPKQGMLGAQALIRNARVKSHDHGLLNEQRHQNVIASNLDWYQSSREQEQEHDILGNTLSGNYGRRDNFVADSPFMTSTVPTVVGTEVTDPGVVHEASIPIDWKHVDQFADMRQFPNIAVGDIDYHIEVEDQIDTLQLAESPVNVLTITNANTGANGQMPALVTDRTRAQIVHPIVVGEQVFVRFIEGGAQRQSFVTVTAVALANNNTLFTVSPAIGGLGNASACTGIALYYGPRIRAGLPPYVASNVAAVANGGFVGSAANPLVLPAFFGADVANVQDVDYSKCPFVVGQYICIHFTQAGNVETHAYTKVAGLSVVNGANAPVGLQIRTEAPVPNPFTVAAASNIKISIPDHSGDGTPFSVSWNIKEAYAQMHVLNLAPAQQDQARKALQEGLQIPWLEQRLVQKHMSKTSTLTETLELLPNCVGVAILTPPTLEFMSSFDGCQSYRMALDGNEVTNRNIECGMWSSKRSIHNHMVKRYFMNLGKSLKKYDAAWINRRAIGYFYDADANQMTQRDVATHSFYPLVVPQKPDYTQLQLQLFTNSADQMREKNIFFVSAHERVLQFKDGRVSVM